MGDCSALRPAPPRRLLRPAANDTAKPTSTITTKTALAIVTQPSGSAPSGKDANAMLILLADSKNSIIIGPSLAA
jgi:hypothetical protein